MDNLNKENRKIARIVFKNYENIKNNNFNIYKVLIVKNKDSYNLSFEERIPAQKPGTYKIFRSIKEAKIFVIKYIGDVFNN